MKTHKTRTIKATSTESLIPKAGTKDVDNHILLQYILSTAKPGRVNAVVGLLQMVASETLRDVGMGSVEAEESSEVAAWVSHR
jgi:hypothetical protein